MYLHQDSLSAKRTSGEDRVSLSSVTCFEQNISPTLLYIQ